MKWYLWKIKRAFKGLFRNKNTPLCDTCEYRGCLKCRIARFTRCAHLFKADCYVMKELPKGGEFKGGKLPFIE